MDYFNDRNKTMTKKPSNKDLKTVDYNLNFEINKDTLKLYKKSK